MNAPNKSYEKLFEKFKEIDSLEIQKWNKNHLLGYFIKKYKDYYSDDYKFKFNTPRASECFELFNINKIIINLSSDPNIVKNYIDWIFENKVKKAKRKLSSISFLTSESDFITFRKLYLSDCLSIDRNIELPDNIKQISNMNTYGDLAFYIASGIGESEVLKKKLLDVGFNLNDLEKVK